MLPKLSKNFISTTILSALSAFVVDVLMDEKIRNRMKRGVVNCRNFIKQLAREGAEAYRNNRDRV